MLFTWKAEDGYFIEDNGSDVVYMTSTDSVTLWVGEDLEGAEAVKVPFEEAAFGWGVVPAPGVAGLLGAGLGVLVWRRRRVPGPGDWAVRRIPSASRASVCQSTCDR
jgi:hypothetical protein